MRFYEITVRSDDGQERRLHVASPTDVQAADAAAPLLTSRESIVSIEEVPDDGLQQVDASPPKTQAEELAPVTPGAAAKT